ncbi:MAG: transposase, partial [Anaerolineae bacterium]|nr:transposase [Anaerolineae bacterium]
VSYACAWLLEDNSTPISIQGARALETGLRQLCDEQDWDFQKLDVQADWIALFLDVPTSVLPNALIDALMQRSEESLRRTESTRGTRLWSDGYLVTTPSEELGNTEIQRFIRFYRREKVGNGR